MKHSRRSFLATASLLTGCAHKPHRPVVGFAPIADTKPASKNLGANVWFISNPTDSFADLVAQAKAIDPDKTGLLVDLHFDAGGGSRPTQIYSKHAAVLAGRLSRSIELIYHEQGWVLKGSNLTMHGDKYLVTQQGNGQDLDVIISEIGFHDDRINGNKITSFLSSEKGQERIAMAILEISRDVDFLAISAGHYGNRGTVGATANNWLHETDYAFGVVNQISQILN